MSDLLTNADFLGLVATWESDGWSPVCDWLDERGVTLPDVLTLYAGTAPAFTDGLPHAALVEWLRRHEPCHTIAHGRVTPGGGVRVTSPPVDRWEAVETIRDDVRLFADTLVNDPAMLGRVGEFARSALAAGIAMGHDTIKPDVNHPVVRAAEAKAKAVTTRDRKRRTLRLFPEVVWRPALPPDA